MVDDQPDASGKYGMNGRGPHGAAKYWPSIFKVIEMLICILCIGLIDEPTTHNRIRVFVRPPTVALAYSTFSTYLIVSVVYLFGKLVRDRWPWKSTAIFSSIAVCLFTACAAALIIDWSQTKERNYWPPNTQRLDLVCAAGFISIIGAIVFLIDAILTFRSGSRGHLGD